MQKRSNLDLWNEYANARKINNKGNCDAEKISDLQKPEYTQRMPGEAMWLFTSQVRSESKC